MRNPVPLSRRIQSENKETPYQVVSLSRYGDPVVIYSGHNREALESLAALRQEQANTDKFGNPAQLNVRCFVRETPST